MRKYEVDEWLKAQKNKDWLKDLHDSDEALNLTLFACHWVFHPQTEENVKGEYKKIAELVNELGPKSGYTPESAEMEFKSWQSTIERPKPDWSKTSSESLEVHEFRQKYKIDEWLERKSYN